MSTINISTKKSKNEKKIYYYLEWGRGPGQRVTTKIFTWANPANRKEKRFNEEQLAILDHKKSQLILDRNGTINQYFAPDKLERNFFDYYQAYVDKNKRTKRRHLENSLIQLKAFTKKEIGADILHNTQISEDFCKRFRQHLLDKYNGETPQNYFSEFKRVLEAASKLGYFRISPADGVAARRKPSKPKDIPSAEEALRLFESYCYNPEVKMAFMFSMYTAMAWVDVKALKWNRIQDDKLLYQRGKTKTYVAVPLHANAKAILATLPKGGSDDFVFDLPSHKGALKALSDWTKNANISKHLTWHSARHFVSVVLQLRGVDAQTVAGILGHTSTQYVQKTYKRYVTSAAVEAINKL